MAERRRAEAHARLDRIRDSEPTEHGLERRPPLLDGWCDERDLLRRRAAAEQRDEFLADELECAAGTGALEEAHSGVEVGRRRWGLLEERAFQVRECGMGVVAPTGRQLLDAAVGERGEVVGCAASEANAMRPGS